jgi:hypothetical protein
MAPVPEYTYLISDLLTNRTLAEVPLSGVRYSKKLGDRGQLSATLTLGDPRVQVLDPYDLTTPARRVVYVVRDDQPVWGGLVWTRRFDAGAQQISLGCADFWSYFDHRKVLPRLVEQVYQDPRYLAQNARVDFLDVDQNDIVRLLVDLAQQHEGGDIGVDTRGDGRLSGITRSRTYFGYQNVNTGDALRTLAGIEDGPDILFDVGPFDGNGRPTKVLRVGTPSLGRRRTSHVWELGANLLSYTWPSDGTRMTTRSFAVGEGVERGLLIAVAEERTRYRDGWPLLEGERGYSSVADPEELKAHAAADQRAGRLPVALPTLVAHGGLPPTVDEVDVGDDGRVVIADAFHTKGVDTTMRVVATEVVVGGDGAETLTLTMNPLLEDVT